MGSCELWAWESLFTGMEENYSLFWWFPQKSLTDLSPVLSSLGFCDHTCCDFQLPFCWWLLSFVKFPVSPWPLNADATWVLC